MARIVSKFINDLDAHEYRQIWGLTLGEIGYMREEIYHQKYKPKARAKAYMLKEDGRVLSWALVMPPGESHRWGRDSGETDVYLFTRKSERRKGYAKRVLARVRRVYGTVRCHPHDHVSGDFFQTINGIKIHPVGRHWINGVWKDQRSSHSQTRPAGVGSAGRRVSVHRV